MATENDNHLDSIELVYAAALLNLAEEAGSADDVNAEVRELGQLLTGQPGLIGLLGSQVLSARHRAASLEKMFQGNISDLLYRFIQVVNEKERLGHLPGIFKAFIHLYEQRRGVIQVDATVAARLDDQQSARIASNLGQAIGRTVHLNQQVDPDLIGGLKVRIADRLVDGSVAAQLRIIKQKMIASGREKAREQALANKA